MKKILSRAEVDPKETWDLRDLYATEEACEQAMKDVQEAVNAFVARFSGKIADAGSVNEAVDMARPIEEQMDLLSHYAMLDVEVDVTNNQPMQRYLAAGNKLSELAAKMSFLNTELAALPESVLLEAKEASSENDFYLSDLLKKKAHLLSADAEAVIAALSPTLEAPYRTYSDIKFSDITFPEFEVGGRTYEMTYNSFEGHMEHENDFALRRKAFDIFSEALKKHEHATASVYNTQVEKEKILATLRGYDSVFDMLLDWQDVSREMYDRQIDLIMKHLAPAMRRYAKLIGRVHGIEHMTTADLKLEVDPDYSPSVTYEKARDYVLDGLSVLGEDYGQILRAAFSDRWIDYSENKGKRTGAFCASPYGSHSYILLSFNHKMDEVMTLAHELGHAGHFTIAGRNQNIFNTRCSMYFVEAPSTTNEIIMENYLLKQAGEDKRMRRWVLSQMISKTYYHNFVTHLLEAAYQREVYKIVDQGGSVQAETLNEIYRRVLTEFWGDEVEVLDGSTRTWMRQPHYYNGLYSYTYSAGLTVGTQMARRIMTEGEHVAQDWLRVLAAGGTKNPVELAAMAGVDITTDQPLRDTIDYISSIIDEIISLTEEMDGK